MAVIKSLTLRCEDKGRMAFVIREMNDEPEGNEILLKTVFNVISPGTELSRILDAHTKHVPFPCMTGYLSEGTVEAVGPDVKNVKVGDYVRCGNSNMARYNTSADNCRLITEDVKPGSAAYAGLMAIPLRGIRNAKVRMGDTVLVFGMGPIGLFAAMWAKVDGAATVIGIDPLAYRRELALQLGADAAVAPEDVGDAVSTLTDDGCDVVVDATGTTRVIADSFQYAANYGRVAVLGGIHGKVEVDLYTNFQKRNLTMVGCGSNRPEDYPYDNSDTEEKAILKMIERGMIDPYPALTYAPVADAIDCYDHLINRDADVITYCIDWSEADALQAELGELETWDI